MQTTNKTMGTLFMGEAVVLVLATWAALPAPAMTAAISA
jgi:hypothetical protein